VVCLVIGFAIGNWYYSERLATLDTQVAFWKDKATAPPPAPSLTPSVTPSAPVSAPSHFTLYAQGASFYTSPGDSSLTGIVLDVQIRNFGPSSVATEWKLKVTPKGGSAVAAQFNPIRKDLVVPGDPPVVVRSSEGLAEKTGNKPILNGKAVSGRLLFYVGMPLAMVQDDSTMLTLSAQDIAGNEVSTAQLAGDWRHTHAALTR
jgi:hypothetical protein